MLPAVLDQTILSTALPTIAGDLGRLTDVSWVVSAYVVAAAATTPLWGKLGDRHGRKRLLEVALGCSSPPRPCPALAQDMTWLIVSRTVQGVGAGGLMTLAMAAVGDLVAPRERARYQGYIAAVFAVATIVGPLLGGAAGPARKLAVGLLRQPATRRGRAGRPEVRGSRPPRCPAPTTRSIPPARRCWPARPRR